ncbi:MAG: hypothetical protein EOL97_09765 [Spirochaetia bacterium]|nr:hypothetical protein [Spirochaetia bacterium]
MLVPCFFFGCSFIEENESEENETILTIGQSWTSPNNIIYKVTLVENTDAMRSVLGDTYAYAIHATNHFIIVHFEVENKYSENARPRLSGCRLELQSPKANYSPKDYIYAYNRMGLSDLQPLEKATYWVVFDVPYKSTERDYHFCWDYSKKISVEWGI